MLDRIMSNSSFDTESDSVISGHRMSSMKLLTFPECSSLNEDKKYRISVNFHLLFCNE